MGHAVGLVCDASTGGPYEAGLFAEIDMALELGITRIPMQRTVGVGDLTAAWRTYAVIRNLRPDVVHGHGAKGGLYARLFGTLMRPRSGRFYSPHGGSLHFDPASLKGRAIFTVERMLERATDGLFFVCALERQVYERKVGKPAAPSHIVYNGLRDAEFEPLPTEGLPYDILFIGEMRALKGPDLLIGAVPHVEKLIGRKLRILMVGAGHEIEALRGQAAGLGLADRIEFHPPMPARQAFAQAPLVVVPSRAEAFPYIVLEALAARRVVIASSVGGIPEIFGEGSPTLIDANESSLVERLCQALAEPKSFATLMPSPATLRSRFSVETMAREITRSYGLTARHHPEQSTPSSKQ